MDADCDLNGTPRTKFCLDVIAPTTSALWKTLTTQCATTEGATYASAVKTTMRRMIP